jgi:tRNA threonylcarbamoyl adenosine modification protein YjeE
VTARSEKRTDSVEGTERLGAAFAPVLRAGDVVALSGPLGAGKTRFVSGLVRALCPGARVRSPSFTLVNEFSGSPSVFHLDLYRLEGTRDVEGLGLEEYAERGALVVEWGERLPNAWLADALHVAITPGDGDVRLLLASGTGERGAALFAAWCEMTEPA